MPRKTTFEERARKYCQALINLREIRRLMRAWPCTKRVKDQSCQLQIWALEMEDEDMCPNCLKRGPMYEEKHRAQAALYQAKARMLDAYNLEGGGR